MYVVVESDVLAIIFGCNAVVDSVVDVPVLFHRHGSDRTRPAHRVGLVHDDGLVASLVALISSTKMTLPL